MNDYIYKLFHSIDMKIYNEHDMIENFATIENQPYNNSR